MSPRLRRNVYLPRMGRWALGALRLLGGVFLLTAISVSASHSHIGEISSATHCVVCQAVGLELDSGAELPKPPIMAEAREDWVPRPLSRPTSASIRQGPLPRGPPISA